MRFYIILFFITGVIIGQEKEYDNIHSLAVGDSIKSVKIDSLLYSYIDKKDFLSVDKVGDTYSIWHYKNRRGSKAIEALLISIQYHQRTPLNLQKKYYRLGQFYDIEKQFKKSIKSYKKAIEIDAHPLRTSRTYQLLGFSYYHDEDYYNSQQCFEIAEQGFRKANDTLRLIRNHITSFNTYLKIDTKKSLDKSIKNLLEADTLAVTTAIPLRIRLQLKRALLQHFVSFKRRNLKLGEKYGSQALDVAFQLNDSLQIANIYNSLGNLFDHDDPAKAIIYIEKALQYNTQSKAIKAISFANLGLSHSKSGSYDQSIEYFNKSLVTLTGIDFESESAQKIQNVLNAEYNTNVQYDTNNNLWRIIRNLAEAYLLQYDDTKDSASLQKSLYYFGLADIIIDLFNNNIDNKQAKLIWRRQATEIYGRALKAAFITNNKEAAFQFMEKNKALVLYEENHKQQLLHDLKLDKDILDRKLQLDRKIIELERKKDSIKQTSESLLATKEMLKKLMDTIRTKYPSYSLTKKIYQPNSISEIQNKLDTDTVILEYHVTIDEGFGIYPNQNKAYLTCISKEEKHLLEIDISKKLIEQLHQLQVKPFRTEEDISAYNDLSLQVYNKLFPNEISNIITNKKLTIIPDNYLSTISFEGLIVSNTKPNDYLINHHQISYQYSYTFHDQNKNNSIITNQNFAAFAPVHFNNPNLGELTESISEVDILHQYFDGHTFLEKKATKASFSEILGKTNIIHLATHADANDSIAPWIAFSDKKMYLDELSLLINNASLVVLNACNTTKGKIATGEGVMSLARGFFYGGAQSTISSLWNVNDKSSQQIISSFYKNIDLGLTKSEALHNAKVDYIKNHFGSEVSPYYWASLILIGDTSPLLKDNEYNDYYNIILISILIIAMISIIFIYSKKYS